MARKQRNEEGNTAQDLCCLTLTQETDCCQGTFRELYFKITLAQKRARFAFT